MLADRTRGGPGWQPWDMHRVRISQLEAALDYLASEEGEDERTSLVSPDQAAQREQTAFDRPPGWLKAKDDT